tara:strand:- start:161 stop:586 length:426 start_codon:yes stop_codon:yes gene_type:complete
MVTISDVSKFLVTQTIAWTVRNPLEALATSAIISNPTTRGLVIQIAKHQAGQIVRDVSFYGRLVSTNVLAPAARQTIRQVTTVAKTPAVAIPAAAITAAAVGATISSVTVTNINRESNISSSSPLAMWSPFGGMGFGSVVT